MHGYRKDLTVTGNYEIINHAFNLPESVMWYYILDMSDYVISKHKTVQKQTLEFAKVALIQRGTRMADSVENIRKGDCFYGKNNR